MNRRKLTLYCLTSAVVLAVSPLWAWQSSNGVQRKVHFARVPTRVGDRVDQQVVVEMDLKTTITQSGQTAGESEDKMVRRQDRVVEVTKVTGEKFKSAQVSFPQSRLVVPGENANPDEPQVVEGKSYVFTREGEDVKITDLAGEVPPIEEYKIVADSLKTLGTPNLLAKHLIEKQPQIGERMLVPRKVARSLFGMNDDIGAIKRFEMTFRELQTSQTSGALLALFDTKIETMPSEASPLEMSVKGQVTIEVKTCRTISATLSGPIGMSTVQPTEGGVLHYGVSGKLVMATRADYR